MVVLATDGRTPADAAARVVRRMADPARVAVIVVGVAPDDRLASRGAGTDDAAHARRAIDATVAATADDLTSAGFATATEVAEGDPARRIIEVAGRRQADLIVVGARPWGLPGVFVDVQRVAERLTRSQSGGRADRASLFDSVSTTVMHHASAPVMVVHDARPRVVSADPTRVLVGADGSAAADAARRTFMLVSDPARVDVTVLAVAQGDPNLDVRLDAAAGSVIALGSRIAAVDPEVARQVAEAQEHPAHTAAVAAVQDLRVHGFRARADVVEGDPRRVLLDHLRHDAVDLAVVGSRGLGLVRRVTLGSVSEALVHAGPATLVACAPDTDAG